MGTSRKETEMSERDEALDAVLHAWNDAGIRPDYHETIKTRLRIEWPTLAAALERLAQTHHA
jgi:hypothetical protein